MARFLIFIVVHMSFLTFQQFLILVSHLFPINFIIDYKNFPYFINTLHFQYAILILDFHNLSSIDLYLQLIQLEFSLYFKSITT